MATPLAELPHGSDRDSDRSILFIDDDDDHRILTTAPKRRFLLGSFSVMCLVFNRMIGSGIFNTPGYVTQRTQSTGITLIFWFAGFVYALAATHVYIEYGLNVPRRRFGGIKQGIPRSGGDLNYIQYVYKWPAYRKDTVLLSTCLFGFSFIILGNMAGNSINFAKRVLQASSNDINYDPPNGAVRGIAISAATFACVIHAFSRRGGIWLNNLLAMIKIAILLLIIIAAIIVGAGGLPKTKNVIQENTDINSSFQGASSNPNSYAHAFLAIIFAFSGYEQPNYVLGEINRPRRKFPIASAAAVSVVCVLYMAVNISYMVVVPKLDQITSGVNVAQRFFELTFGKLSASGDNTAQRIFNAFLAISSFGNIVVMTYTAARVKQEIAKEGILPWPKFFAQNSDVSLGRLLNWIQGKPSLSKPFHRILKLRWLSPKEHSEKTPVGAMFLHLLMCVILILATYGFTPDEAYSLLTGLAAYVINSFFGALLAAGILILRLKPSYNWKSKSKGFSPFLSFLSASIFLIGNLFPLIVTWVKLQAADLGALKWFLTPTVGCCVVAFGALWWLGFLAVAKRKERKDGTVFTVEKVPHFERDPPDMGPPVEIYQEVYIAWEGKESLSGKDTDRQTDFDRVLVVP